MAAGLTVQDVRDFIYSVIPNDIHAIKTDVEGNGVTLEYIAEEGDCCILIVPSHGKQFLVRIMEHDIQNPCETPCQQCGEPLGPEIFLGVVCGKCCRANQRKVARRK